MSQNSGYVPTRHLGLYLGMHIPKRQLRLCMYMSPVRVGVLQTREDYLLGSNFCTQIKSFVPVCSIANLVYISFPEDSRIPLLRFQGFFGFVGFSTKTESLPFNWCSVSIRH
jgi:hypothetical protein